MNDKANNLVYPPAGPVLVDPDNGDFAPRLLDLAQAVLLFHTEHEPAPPRLSEPPVREGSRVAFVARFLGRRLGYTYDVVEYRPGQRLVMRTAEGPFPMETTYTWRTEGTDRTRMTLRNRGEPAGFSRLAGPFVAMAMRRANRNDLAALKARLESTG
jgi:hypothetical protein